MIQLLKMAFRDLGRNRRRSFFSALALGLGLALLLLMASVVSGEINGSMDSSIKLQSGHLQVRSKSYDENKNSLSWDRLIENPGDLAAKIAAMPEVKTATPRLFASGIIAFGKKSVGVSILGIDPASDANAPYRSGMVSGAFLDAADRDGVLMGQTLADKLKLNTGDQVDLLVNTASGEVAEQAFNIRGIYTTHTPGFDQGTLFMPLDKAQGITKTGNHATILFVLLKDRAQTDNVAAQLQSEPYQVKTYVQMNDLLSQTEAMSSAYLAVLYLIVLAITATVIVNTLIMAVFERTREIGILAAIGMKSSRIMAMFFLESILLALGGILIGFVLGALLVTYASQVGFYVGNLGMTGFLLGERIYGQLNLKDTVNLTVMALVITLLAAVYPAVLAARMDPVEALHGGK